MSHSRGRVRTAVNVMGDCYCAGIMSHWFQDEFDNSETNQVMNLTTHQTSF